MAKKGGTQVQAKQANFTAHAGQPSGHSGFKETQQNNRTVKGGVTKTKDNPNAKLKEGNLTSHSGQPSGKSIGFKTGEQGSKVQAVPGIYSPLNGKGILTYPKGTTPYKFRGTYGSGPLRMSGVKGAHRLGCKK